MKLLTEQGCILVHNWVVKFFGYFLSFLQCTCYTYYGNYWLYCSLRYTGLTGDLKYNEYLACMFIDCSIRVTHY